jgi:hypothetical protein
MYFLAAVASLVAFGQSQTPKTAKPDHEIKQAVIAESIASYRGSCPCPNNRDRVGHKCGARSALCEIRNNVQAEFSNPVTPEFKLLSWTKTNSEWIIAWPTEHGTFL